MHSSRSITFSQGVALYMGAVLGSGILILPGYTANIAGPSSIVSWVILSLLSIPLAYTFARLALKYKDFGGVSTIVQKAFGYKWSAIVGWFFFAWVATGQAVVGMTGAGYIVHIFQLSDVYLYLLGFLFLCATFIINIRGIKTSGLFSLWLSGGVLLLLIVTIIFALPEIDLDHFSPFAPNGLTGIGQSCVLIFWAFFGWETITHLVPEFKDPERDVMRSTWVSVILIGLVYTLLSIVTVGTHTYGNNTGDAAPLAVLMNKTLGLNAGAATAIVSCVVCLGTLNVFLASSSRLGYALAKEGKFPQWFHKMSRRHVPYRAAFFLFLSNSLTILASYVFKIPVDELILIPTTLGVFVYIIASMACLKLLWNDRIGRISALLSVCCCVVIAPFAFSYLIVPVIISVACLLFLRLKPHRAKADV